MKAVVLAIMTLLAAATGVGAETYVSGFNPRFGIAPKNPDNPDYRPPDRPRANFDFNIDIDELTWSDWRGRDQDRDRPRRRHHDRR